MPRLLVLFLLPVALLGCDSGIYACTMEVVPGLRIEVRAADGADLDAGGVLGLARDGSFVDTLSIFDPMDGTLDLYGAHERAGRYDVTISKPGYRTWRRDGVRVTEDECHVRTVRLEAPLERE